MGREILAGYSKEDIWNLDEIGCFWKALSTKGFCEKAHQCKAHQCKGRKKSKLQVTVAFIVNAAGDEEKKS